MASSRLNESKRDILIVPKGKVIIPKLQGTEKLGISGLIKDSLRTNEEQKSAKEPTQEQNQV